MQTHIYKEAMTIYFFTWNKEVQAKKTPRTETLSPIIYLHTNF